MLLVAALLRVSVSSGVAQTIAFLKVYTDGLPDKVRTWLVRACGGASFVFLLAAAYYSNYLGEALVPQAARAFGFFGEQRAAWAYYHHSQWGALRDGISAQWASENTAGGERPNGIKAAATLRTAAGKRDVRLARSLFAYALLLPLAGLADLARRQYARRGVVLMVVGLCLSVSLCAIWAHRKNHYVDAVLLVNDGLQHPLAVPDGLRHAGAAP